MKKPATLLWIFIAAAICFAAVVIWALFSGPKYPVAMVRVVDAHGLPVAGAIIKPEGLRTKAGPFAADWYGWGNAGNAVPATPVTTDKDGFASVGYPKYVFEKIETGIITFSVNHADFVPERAERVVSVRPPAGSSWRQWFDYLTARIQHKGLMAQVDPVTLQAGAVLKVSAASEPAAITNACTYVQISGTSDENGDFWLRPEPGVAVTRRLGTGTQIIRAVQFEPSGAAWFGDTESINAVVGQTNNLVVALTKGVAVRGRLDSIVPRPVKNTRVIVNVWPEGYEAKDSPPQWHAWTHAAEDGTFQIPSLPQGKLEIVALCDGFVSTNGPGKTNMRYPQQHVLGTNDLEVVIGMEPTARLEVRVTDQQGKPVKGALVSAWPNVRYGEWEATILGQDCYNTAGLLLSKPGEKFSFWTHRVPDFEGKSDATGLAVIPNLPATVKEIAVDHPQLELRAVSTGFGGKRRQAMVSLFAGVTNQASVQLEPKGAAPIAHY